MKKEVIILLILLILPFVSSLEYETDAKEITLNYILNGEESELSFMVYGGVVNYLDTLPKSISFADGETPLLADFKLKHINNEIQRGYLVALVDKIKEIEEDEINQMRIAVSIVQSIEYGKSNKTISLNSKQETEYSRWPYEVLYDEQGMCAEKSELLVFLLKELGYETGILSYLRENHEAVYIGCPKKYGLGETSKCFVETTGPSIITDDSIEYVGGIKLESSPILVELYGGEGIEKGMREYKDAKLMRKISEGKFVFFKKWRLNLLKKRYGLVKGYNLE